MLRRLADSIIVLWGWRRVAVAFVAGLVSTLALAPWHVVPVLWLTLPVFVWLLDGAAAADDGRASPWISAAIGWCFGFGYFLGGLWWLALPVAARGGPWIVAAPLMPLVAAAVLAVFWGAAAALARAAWTEDGRRVVVLAVAMTAAEWLRHAVVPLPWHAFGNTLAPIPVMMQSLAIVGPWGLTAIAVVIFAAPATLLSGEGWRAPASRRVAVVAAALLVLHVAGGAIRLAVDAPATSTAAVRIVQPAAVAEPGTTTSQAALDRLLDLSGETAVTAPALIVWPQASLPTALTRDARALAAIAALVSPGAALITGARRPDVTGGEGRPFRSLFIVDDAGEVRGAFDQARFVPVLETWPAFLPGAGLSFASGTGRRALSLPDGREIVPLVGLEGVAPASPAETEGAPAWQVNVADDSLLGAVAAGQNLHQARLRAVAFGHPVIRAANSGVSAVVDARGRLVGRSVFGATGTVDVMLSEAVTTPYARYGDIAAALAILMVATAVIFATGGRRRD